MIAENPKITELKPYKGFRIFKYVTYSNCYGYIHYEAFKDRFGEVEEYIDECYTLKDCKQKIDFLLQEKSALME